MPRTITLTIVIQDDVCCPSCQASFELDLNELAIFIGQCEECGSELMLDAEDGIEWGVQQ